MPLPAVRLAAAQSTGAPWGTPSRQPQLSQLLPAAAPQRPSRQLQGQRRGCAPPLCRAAVQDQPSLSQLLLEQHFRQQRPSRTGDAGAAHHSESHSHATGAQSSGALLEPAASASELRGEAGGNTAADVDASPQQRPSIAQLAAALATLPGHVSSAHVLDGVHLDMPDICSILTELAKLRQPDRALATFAWFEQSPDYSVDSCLLYTRMISILGRHKRHAAAALRIFDRMQARRIRPDLVCYNAAINVAGKALQYDRAQRLFEQLQRNGFQPNVRTYTSLIGACQKVGKWQEAWAAIDEMQAAGVTPNVLTYTTLMSACTRAGQWQRALEAFQALEADGLTPDVHAYNSAITACAAAGGWEKAWALFGTMKRLRMQPTTRSYNALLSACERAGQADRALEVWANMQRAARRGGAEVQPTAVTYNTLLSACGKAGRFDDTMRLYSGMQAARLPADAYTLTALLTACERVGKWERAVELMEEMCAGGVAPNIHHHNCLLSAFSRAGEWQQALGKLREVCDAAPRLRPDAVTYSCAITACQRGGQPGFAFALFDEMLEKRLVPHGSLFATLIAACERSGDLQRALQLFHTMKEMDVDAPSVSMAARRVMYAWPQVVELFPPALISAAHATFASGRAARQWLDNRQ